MVTLPSAATTSFSSVKATDLRAVDGRGWILSNVRVIACRGKGGCGLLASWGKKEVLKKSLKRDFFENSTEAYFGFHFFSGILPVWNAPLSREFRCCCLKEV